MSSFEERLEAQDQVVHVINQLCKRWEERITRRNLRLADRFINFELHILLHFSVKNSDPTEMWVACFNVVRPIAVLSEPVSNKEAIIVVSEKSAVLVNVVKLVDSPERVIPTTVRFERINRFYSFGAHALYFSSLFPFVSSGVLRNRT